MLDPRTSSRSRPFRADDSPTEMVPVVFAVPPARRVDLFGTRVEAANREKTRRDLCNDRMGDGQQAVILYSIPDYRERP
jgi:hypothetical protein